MSRHVTATNSLLRVALALLLCVYLFGGWLMVDAHAQQAAAQQSKRELGISLYEQGDLQEALKALRAAVKENKSDADAWHHLGLAYYRTDKIKEARKALEKAVELRPHDAMTRTALAYTLLLANKILEAGREAERALALNSQNPEAFYVVGVVRFRTGEFNEALKSTETALMLKPDLPQAFLLKSQILLAIYSFEAPLNEKAALKTELNDKGYTQLKEAAESLEKYLQMKPDAANAETWREQLESLRIYEQLADKTRPAAERDIFKPSHLREDPTAMKARILVKPSPAYTTEARVAQVVGTVILQMVLAADGKVKHILVLRGLSHGLTEQAVKAARRIRFDPAMKGGRPVSQSVKVEYNFNIY